MVRYTAASPYQLQAKQLDYVVIYADRDIEKAVQFDQRLKDLQLDGCLYDGKVGCPFDWIIQGPDAKKDLYKRSTFKFFIITDELADDVDFILEKNEAIQADLKKRDQTIVPIWYVGKYDLNDDAFDALYGITSLQGLDPKSSYFDTKVKKMAAMEMFTKRKEEREKKQDDAWKVFQEYQAKQPKNEPKAPKFHAPTDTEGPVGKSDIHYHLHIDSGGASNREPVQCYTVAKQFWRNFQTPMGSGLRPDDERHLSLTSQPSDAFNSDGNPADITEDEGPASDETTHDRSQMESTTTTAPRTERRTQTMQPESGHDAKKAKMVVKGDTVNVPVKVESQHTGATADLDKLRVDDQAE